MSLRKNRIPLHGLSNFRKTQTEFYPKQKQSWNPIQTIRQKNDKNMPSELPFEKSIITRNKSQPKQALFNTKAISQIRKAYKNRPNVWRIAKAWKFAQQGFVTQNQFKQNMKGVVRNNVTNDQMTEIFKKITCENGKIDIECFLKLIYGQGSSFCFKPRLFNIKDENKVRENKIYNLVDKLSIYESAENKKQINNSKIKNNQNFNKNSFSQKFQKRKLTKSQSSIKQEFSKQQFQRITQTSFAKLKDANKSNAFSPQLMLNIDQNKTRFGATLYPSNEWYSPNRTLEKFNKIYDSDKMKNIALTQKAEKEMKFLARMEKIRLMQNRQKENIQQNETKLKQKDNNRLLRKKLDRQAYEYSSFIRNKWL